MIGLPPMERDEERERVRERNYFFRKETHQLSKHIRHTKNPEEKQVN